MTNNADFAIVKGTLDESAVLRVVGELDLTTAPTFEEALMSTGSDSDLIVDLSACTFLDSSGLKVIAAAANRHPRVSIVATDPTILRVLEITALDTMVPVHASLEDAR